jgi:DNA-binding transcriptional LysR family regulator
MDADDLALLDAVIAAGSVTAAASKLNIPKTTVSRRLQRLEAAAGAPLFDRAGRRLRLTQLGSRLAVPAAQLRASLAEARSVAQAARGGPSQLRITSPFLFGRIVLSGYFARFLAAHPAVTGCLKFDNAWIDPLRDDFDLAVRIEPPVETYLTVAKLATARLRLYAAPAMAASIATPSDLAHFAAVVTSNRPAADFRWQLSDGSRKLEVSAEVRCNVNDPEAACEMVARGIGVGALPTFLANPLVETGALAPVLARLNAGKVSVYAVLPPGRLRIPLIREFLDGLKDELASGRILQ